MKALGTVFRGFRASWRTGASRKGQDELLPKRLGVSRNDGLQDKLAQSETFCVRVEHDFKPDIEAIAAIDAVPTILNVVCRVTGMGFAAVARVTSDRWVCLAVHDEIQFGLVPGGELQVESTLCHEVRQSREVIAIDHVAEDEFFCNHHTPAKYGFQSYISMPIFLKDGSFYGTLCAIDPKPRKLKNPGIIGMFRLFADLIAIHLETVGRLAAAEAKLLDASEAMELRDQFIAVLGHDLRNPLASIAAGSRLLENTPLDDKARTITDMMRKSVMRMSALIDNLMDFARGRLGGGIVLNRKRGSLEPTLRHIIDELRSAYPDRKIEAEFNLIEPIPADYARIGQMVSNLLGNAIAYGEVDKPIVVRGTTNEVFELSVANQGPVIPAATIEKLFAPFTRGKVRSDQQGLGLGLYIASEIAQAHGGVLEVMSTPAETRFTFRMPLSQQRR